MRGSAGICGHFGKFLAESPNLRWFPQVPDHFIWTVRLHEWALPHRRDSIWPIIIHLTRNTASSFKKPLDTPIYCVIYSVCHILYADW